MLWPAKGQVNARCPSEQAGTGSDTTPRIAPDLSVTKSDGGASVEPGGTVAYTLTYAYTGTAAATGVVLTGYGQGKVIYATIPLDFYLEGFGPPSLVTNMAIYAANVLAYADDLR